MRTLLIERGVPADKISVVFNWVDEDVFRPVAQAQREGGQSFEIMYAGNIGDVQGLDIAVRAVALASREADVVLRMIGTGVAVEISYRAGGRNSVSRTESGSRARGPSRRWPRPWPLPTFNWSASRTTRLFTLTMPSKIQAILACGHPILTCAPGDAAALTVESGAGWACAAGDAEGLARSDGRGQPSVRRGPAAKGEVGRAFYEERLSSEVGSAMLVGALKTAFEDV